MPSHNLVFIDESGVKTNMTPRYGRAEGGNRVVDNTPVNTRISTTIVSSIRLDGETVYKHFEGGLNGEKFIEYLRDDLSKSLRRGDIVIMDNLRTHKVQGVAQIIEDVGATIAYLPPYSPELNPIENMWSKLKCLIRKMKARSQKELESAIKYAFTFIEPTDVEGWFAHACYCI